jgi:SPP1 gp7 family putative phage head morphogenesis protein
MPSNDRLSTLRAVDRKLGEFIAKEFTRGEGFSPVYKKNPEIFRQLIQKRIQLKRSVARYFRKQQETMHKFVNLHLIVAAEKKVTVQDIINAEGWAGQDEELASTLEESIAPLYLLGVQSAQLRYKVDLGISQFDSPQAKYLRDYTLGLASDINGTTQDWIKQQIQTSIGLGENRDELTNRLDDLLDNTPRARMIAQTESIRSFSQGRLDVFEKIGVKKVVWVARGGNPCPICSDLDGEVTELGTPFSTGDDAPPAHPNCECGVEDADYVDEYYQE